MACNVQLEKKIILQTTSGVMEALHLEFLHIVEDKNIIMNDDLQNFIDKLQFSSLTTGGEPFYIEEIITSSEKMQTIIFILAIAINNIKSELAGFALKDLWNFYGELEKYKKELKHQGK